MPPMTGAMPRGWHMWVLLCALLLLLGWGLAMAMQWSNQFPPATCQAGCKVERCALRGRYLQGFRVTEMLRKNIASFSSGKYVYFSIRGCHANIDAFCVHFGMCYAVCWACIVIHMVFCLWVPSVDWHLLCKLHFATWCMTSFAIVFWINVAVFSLCDLCVLIVRLLRHSVMRPKMGAPLLTILCFHLVQLLYRSMVSLMQFH